MRLPTLYKKASTGKIQQWTIEVQRGINEEERYGIIKTEFGQVGGKLQTGYDVVREGKNAFKKNETTPVQQAELEAQSKWEKQLKKGYVKTIEEAEAGKVDAVIEGGISPMLAHKFSEQGHKIVYPAYAQPKLDGHRCIAVVQNGKASIWSRTRKPITGVPHIIADIETLCSERNIKNIVLDGELYHHNYRDNFEELSSFIRQEEPKEGHEVVQYHVYDIADAYLDQQRRFDLLRHSVFNDGEKYGALRRVETIWVKDEDDMTVAFEHFLAEGYEGLMVRNEFGAYVNKRSYDLQKVKEMEDAEFEVIGVKEGRGKLAGHAIFICKTNDDPRMDPNATFDAKLKGEQAKLKEFFEHPDRAIGRQLTVQFQGVTNKERVPRFPVALRFRED